MPSLRSSRARFTTSRRRIVALAGGGAALGLLASLVPGTRALASLTATADRPYWRYCIKCQVLFSTDAIDNVCAANGKHQYQGYEFRLPLDRVETSTAQGNWRACKLCRAMFYNGYPRKGRCPARAAPAPGTRISAASAASAAAPVSDRGHVADASFRYVLAHDVPEMKRSQSNWRFCAKCYAMFFNGYPTKGRCAAGDGHVAQGYTFVLPRAF